MDLLLGKKAVEDAGEPGDGGGGSDNNLARLIITRSRSESWSSMLVSLSLLTLSALVASSVRLFVPLSITLL